VSATRRTVAPPAKERFEILVEELKSDFRAVAEGHGMLNTKMEAMRDELNKKIDEMTSDMGTLRQEMTSALGDHRTETTVSIGSLRKEMKEGFASVNVRIDALAQDLAEHRADTEVHSQKYKVSEG
jgi:uncharacterized protein YPO0396